MITDNFTDDDTCCFPIKEEPDLDLEQKANKLLYGWLKQSNFVIYKTLTEEKWVDAHIDSFRKAYELQLSEPEHAFSSKESFEEWLAIYGGSVRTNPTYRASMIKNFEDWCKAYEDLNNSNKQQGSK
jgi:hypothetical protein